jgi:hypothetical protein
LQDDTGVIPSIFDITAPYAVQGQCERGVYFEEISMLREEAFKI